MQRRERSFIVTRRLLEGAKSITGSSIERCVECREVVVVAPSSEPIRQEHRAYVICLECSSELFENHAKVDVETLNDDQVKELREHCE